MRLGISILIIGLLGFVLNRKNIIIMLISIEMMYLGSSIIVLISSINMDDIMGQLYSIYIIGIAGSEVAIGLGILVTYNRLTQNINIRCI